MKVRKILTVFKGIIGYLFTAFLITIFALYCSGRVGWFLLLTLVLAPAISILKAVYIRRKLEVSMDVSMVKLEKGNHTKVKIVIKNKSILITPPIKLTMSNNYNFSCREKKVLVYIGPKGKQEIEFDYVARVSGGSYIGIEEVRISDYFGLYSYALKNEDIINSSVKVGIIPEVMEIKDDNPLVKETMVAAFDQGNNEEVIDEASYFFGGFPGFEYREYQPGDPLKRINTKLSAKQDKLMVRLDEKQAVSSIDMIVDPVKINNGKYNEDMYGGMINEELETLVVANVLETTLGIIREFVWKDFAVNCHYCDKDGWRSISVIDENGISLLADEMADIVMTKECKHGRFPDDSQIGDFQTVMVSTAFFDSDLEYMLTDLRQKKIQKLSVYVGALIGGWSL